jgi:alginate O-acetyltransferase complex protein AlgJ
MLLRRRRHIAVLSFLLLATPLGVGLVWPDSPDWILKEARTPAPAPVLPKNMEAMLAFPEQADAYLKDHFGLRQRMIRLHRDLTRPVLLGASKFAVIGNSGRMFALDDDMVLQSAGRVVRSRKVAEAAEMLTAMRDALDRRGIRFLVALPPNSSTIYPDDLPGWAQNPGTKTEYDLLLDELKARGVKAVDLRPPLKAARANGPTYLMNDLHWSVRGALAGFDAVVEADGHPEWRIDPASAIGPLATRKGGDIARLIGVADSVSESTETLNLRATGHEEILSREIEGRIGPAKDMPDYLVTSDKPGPTVMVIGDSFTVRYFPLFLAQHVGRVIWIHHQYCGFDWGWIDKFRPDEVWWTPVERFLVCWPGQHPKSFEG